MGFLMIPVTTLYDDCIDRPKWSEQKKSVEYIVPPPSGGVGTNKKNEMLKAHFLSFFESLFIIILTRR